MAGPTTLEASEKERQDWVLQKWNELVVELGTITAKVPAQCCKDEITELLARVRWLRDKAVDAGWNVG